MVLSDVGRKFYICIYRDKILKVGEMFNKIKQIFLNYTSGSIQFDLLIWALFFIALYSIFAFVIEFGG